MTVYLLLDIDGVLVTGREMTRRWEASGRTRMAPRDAFDPVAVRNLERLLARFPSVRVVLNTTWRRSPEQVATLFRHLPWLEARMDGCTPPEVSEPADAVQAWLEDHPGAAFICLDDSAAGLIRRFGEERVVATGHESGFTAPHFDDFSRKFLNFSCTIDRAHTRHSGSP